MWVQGTETEETGSLKRGPSGPCMACTCTAITGDKDNFTCKFMAKVFDGLLTPQFENEIEEYSTSYDVKWNLNPNTVTEFDPRVKDPYIFDDFPTFTIVSYTQVYGPMAPIHKFTMKILDEFQSKSGYKVDELLRVRTNLVTKLKTKEGTYMRPHWDTYTPDGKDRDFHVLIYYVNDSDGPTRLFTNGNMYDELQKIDPKKGRFVLFKNCRHAGAYPMDNNMRIVINFNIKIRKIEQS
jgi:hypothetical protein